MKGYLFAMAATKLKYSRLRIRPVQKHRCINLLSFHRVSLSHKSICVSRVYTNTSISEFYAPLLPIFVNVQKAQYCILSHNVFITFDFVHYAEA